MFHLSLVTLLLVLSTPDPAPAAGDFANPPLGQLGHAFDIPEAPAFALLATGESRILRPASLRELVLSASDFAATGTSLTIPRAFAVEFAPALLIGGTRLTVDNYREHAQRYRFRLSVATRREQTADRPGKIAIGGRLTLLDAADLRTHPQYGDYRELATEIATAIQAICDAAYERIGPVRDANGLPLAAQPPIEGLLSTQEKQEIEGLLASLSTYWTEWEDSTWNARKLEVAAAVRASAKDSLASGLSANGYALWLTYGDAVGRWGQLLAGFTAGAERDSTGGDLRLTSSTSVRFYVGRNDFRFFLEGQGTYEDRQAPKWLLNSGGEAKFTDDLWITLTSGLQYDEASRERQLVTHFGVKYGLGRS